MALTLASLTMADSVAKTLQKESNNGQLHVFRGSVGTQYEAGTSTLLDITGSGIVTYSEINDSNYLVNTSSSIVTIEFFIDGKSTPTISYRANAYEYRSAGAILKPVILGVGIPFNTRLIVKGTRGGGGVRWTAVIAYKLD